MCRVPRMCEVLPFFVTAKKNGAVTAGHASFASLVRSPIVGNAFGSFLVGVFHGSGADVAAEPFVTGLACSEVPQPTTIHSGTSAATNALIRALYATWRRGVSSSGVRGHTIA